ncbi:MAG: 8-oxo-dGTP diphosphatase [Candidatus Latescibacterota bacterium]|jgi:8-oxo-dGTP diphosphatase
MPLGSTVAILKENKILLTKREDFEVWCVPGGAVDKGESIPQAAIREAKEETGLTIRLTRMVGLYGRPYNNQVIHSILFAAEPISGDLKTQADEVIDIGYFTLKEALNLQLFADHAQRITDALNGVGGSVAWWHDTPWPFADNIKTRQDLYDLRDQSDVSRQDFYLNNFGQIKPGEGRIQVPSEKIVDQ